MAFGSFSTPAAPNAVAGYNTPQQLFAGLPTGGPGMVTPNTSVAMPMAGMDIQDQVAAYALQQRMKEDRKREWAEAAAKNRANMDFTPGYQKGWHVINPEEEKLKAAFAEVYAPQLRRTFHDQMMASPTAAGQEARRRAHFPAGHIGAYSGSPLSSGQMYNEGRIRHEGQDQQRLNDTLAAMWRMETDPYLRAVGGGMDAGTAVKAMQPGQIPKGLFGSYTFSQDGQRIPLRNG